MKVARKRSSSVSKKRSFKRKVSKRKVSKRKVSKRRNSKKRRRGSRTSRRSTQQGGQCGHKQQYGAGFDGDLFHITSFAEKEKEKTILETVTDTTQEAVDATFQTIGVVAGATRDLAVNAYNTTTSYFK
jgi:hypothetical protein